MNISITTIRHLLLRLRARLGNTNPAQKYASGEPPLRSGLFTADQMEHHGKALAASHTLISGTPQDRLLKRLADNENILLGVRDLLTEAVQASRRIAPAGEWLLDNFYLIEEQIRTAKRHLPKGYSKELPRLQNGQSAGLPRVYDIALETIAHGDGLVDPESLRSFVTSYQTVTILTFGELWAIPIMLRLALVENLRRVAVRVAADRINRNLANTWADQMIEVAEKDPKSLILVIADMARSKPDLVSSFVAELARRLQGQSLDLALPLTWIEQRLSETGRTIEQLVRAENQQQAADRVSISNTINSLRFLGAMDWRIFVETMSVVEQTLREDPADVYDKMDFATRDRYRHAVEKIAKKSACSENEVARKAIQLAHAAAQKDGDAPVAHVGFYLVDKGRRQLEQLAKIRRSALTVLASTSRRFPFPLYSGAILLLTAIFAWLLMAKLTDAGLHGGLLGFMGLLAVLASSHLAVALVNWLATLLATPRPLPRMDFSKGIPQELRTLVVVPTMLTSEEGIGELVEALEVRFLANQDDHLHYGLLTDFRDADAENLPEDVPLLQLTQQRIEELNAKYRNPAGDTFFLFHRPRRWNAQDRIWMGYERKRGKLADLNWLLRAGPDTAIGERFSLVVGTTAILANVKYVITLDTDTQLARDSAWQFVGAMAHPLNRACYDEDKQRVVSGYGILQPRVAISLSGTNRSLYARLCGSEPGIDPYTRAVSDVYQDLFDEGSFIGKGIYEVDAFERALDNRFPDNRILSHDLLEGCYARSGLLSDAQLYEEYPSRYSDDVSRRQRWIRGDWQIAQWVTPVVPGSDGRLRKNPLTPLSRWKIGDNLRRSLVPAALMLLLLLAWTVLPSAWMWTLAVLGIILIPSLIASIWQVLLKPVDVPFGQHLAAAGRSTSQCLAQAALTLTCLPYEAFFSLNAIVRTAWRLLITHRGLLEWNPSSGSCAKRTTLTDACRTMWIAPVLALSTVIVLAYFRPISFLAAAPLLALWLASPVIAWWISRPLAHRQARLSSEQTFFLHVMARKTWAFFETFVGPEDHWLPPDNFQEHPAPVVAHRTSPTNMGLSLLANLSACDFGYISPGKLLERTTSALRTMDTMERYRGHFYNWYDTQSLRPLLPLYVSSVDSGNLAGHLLILRQGLLALADDTLLGKRFFEGLEDTLGIALEAASTAPKTKARLVQLHQEIAATIRSQQPAVLTTLQLELAHWATSAAEMATGMENGDTDSAAPLQWWLNAFVRQCRDGLDEFLFLAPWLENTAVHDGPEKLPDLDRMPTLRELAALAGHILPALEDRFALRATPEEKRWLEALCPLVREASRRADARIATLEQPCPAGKQDGAGGV